jgi:hypothetical protein
MIWLRLGAMVFGGVLALLGVYLFVRMGTTGTNTLKIQWPVKMEMQLAGSALVILVLGVVVFIVPLVIGDGLGAVGPQDGTRAEAGPAGSAAPPAGTAVTPVREPEAKPEAPPEMSSADAGVPPGTYQLGAHHNGCVPFADPPDVVAKGPITGIGVYHEGYINGIRLYYGADGVGERHGFTAGMPETLWRVPPGERVTRVEADIAKNPSGLSYVGRLVFATSAGTYSPRFGQARGDTRIWVAPDGAALTTISGWANLERHSARNRAIAELTLHWGTSNP